MKELIRRWSKLNVMGLNNLLAVFLPKDKVFYTLFEKVAITVVEMGDLLSQVVNEPDYNHGLP